MKPYLLALSIWMQTAAAQQLALLDRNMKEPFLLRDSFTLQDAATGAFPLYTNDIPVVIDQLETVARQLASPVTKPPVAVTYAAHHTRLFLLRRSDGYRCVLQSQSKQYSIPLIVGGGTRKSTLKAISRFVEYLRQNKAVTIAANK